MSRFSFYYFRPSTFISMTSINLTPICTITFIYFCNASKHNNSFEELKSNIILAFGDLKNVHNLLQKVHNNLLQTAKLYIQHHGQHFKHSLSNLIYNIFLVFLKQFKLSTEWKKVIKRILSEPIQNEVLSEKIFLFFSICFCM